MDGTIISGNAFHLVHLTFEYENEGSNVGLLPQGPLNYHASGVPPRLIVRQDFELSGRLLVKTITLMLLFVSDAFLLTVGLPPIYPSEHPKYVV